ncbi:MAG TPA: DUF58 domain-containing protein [Candidatus Goldiibacteriota bacterium]|nr:DUF58 domain-containing protein [Candidatus Goldiibacteriota bacterium]
MISKEILKKIKRIEISTRRLVDTVLQGEYLSSFKGRGMEFDEVREYAEGDDIRAIDWNVTARMNTPFVKTFIEERELQVVFAADMSASLAFGSKEDLKSGLMFEFTAAMAFSASINNDRAGFLGFSSEIEKYIPPKKGKKHVLRIIREMLYHRQKSRGTDITAALKYLSHILKKRSTVFVISDFYDNRGFEEGLKMLRHRHDVVPVVLRDERDFEIPDIGYAPFYDAEEGKVVWTDTSDRRAMEKFRKSALAYDTRLFKSFSSLGLDYMTLTCGRPVMREITAFFRKRERMRAR